MQGICWEESNGGPDKYSGQEPVYKTEEGSFIVQMQMLESLLIGHDYNASIPYIAQSVQIRSISAEQCRS